MRIPFVKLSPNGNTTILLRGTFSPEERVRLTSRVIEVDHLGAEQAGVIDTADMPRLTMMGGEFCVNASRAFAGLLAFEAKQQGLSDALWQGQFRVSGMDAPLLGRVKLHDEQSCTSSIRLRMPTRPVVETPQPGVRVVNLSGITHVLLDADAHPLNEKDALPDAALWRSKLGLTSEPAVGIVRLWQQDRDLRIFPVVWVNGTDSTVVETACGSGSLAAALACADNGEGLWRVAQAGGVLDVELSTDEGFAAWIGGEVRVVAQGEAYL